MKNIRTDYVLDTSYVSSLFVSSDTNHTKAKELLGTILTKDIIIPITVLMELEVLQKSHNHKNLKEPIQRSLNRLPHKVQSLDLNFLESYKEINPRLNQKIKSTDLSIITVAYMTSSNLITFDQKMEAVWKDLVETS